MVGESLRKFANLTAIKYDGNMLYSLASMKNQFFLFLLVFITSLSSLADGEHQIQYPKSGTLHLKNCESPIDCNFSGKQSVRGKYEVIVYSPSKESEQCPEFQSNCFELNFYPQKNSSLPHFAGYTPDYISIANKMEALKLITNSKIFDDITHNKIKGISGTATVMGIACDHGYAVADILQVTTKSRPKVAVNDVGGC
jgi:hypothetical protein